MEPSPPYRRMGLSILDVGCCRQDVNPSLQGSDWTHTACRSSKYPRSFKGNFTTSYPLPIPLSSILHIPDGDVPSDLIQLLRMGLFPRSPHTFTVCFTLPFLELVKGMIHMCFSPHMDIQTVFVSYQTQDKLPDKNHFVEVMVQYRFLIRLGVTRLTLRLGVDLTPEHCPAFYQYDHRVLVMDGNFKWWKQVRLILPNTTHPNFTTYH